MSTKDKTIYYYTSTLDKVNQPTISMLLKKQNQITAIISEYPYKEPYQGDYVHDFLIYRVTVWLIKDIINNIFNINNPQPFNGTSSSARYAYNENLKLYEDIIKKRKEAIRMINYIFPKPVF